MDDLGGNTMDTDSVKQQKNKRKRESVRTGRIVSLASQLGYLNGVMRMKHDRTTQYEFVNEVLMISVAEFVVLYAAGLSLLAVEEALDRGTLMGLLP
jgi:hypothetical protein